jgi:cysteine desulfurase/selenocysteine lyase
MMTLTQQIKEGVMGNQTKMNFNIEKIRSDFPILSRQVNGKPLVYFDNAATSQKPQCVIDALVRYYSEYNSNVHRGVHFLSEKATEEYENSRKKIQKFINAEESSEIIFVRGTTEGINLVAYSYVNTFLKEGDEIIISQMEHHSNIVPWQILRDNKGIVLKIIPVNDRGELRMDEFEKLLTEKTKFVSVVHISNSLGTINPIKEIIEISHKHNIPVLIDGAQSVPHTKIDVQDLDCDFFAFSGHKMYGPTGIGVLYAKKKYLEIMPPYQGGGDMIKTVTFEKTIYNDLPHKFEAGTPNIADTIGLGAAIDYINETGYENISYHENELLKYGTEKLTEFPEIRIIGTAKYKASVISFLIGDIHPYDAGVILDKLGIAVRTGVHCTQPIIDYYKLPGTVRASFCFYNTKQEIDILVEGVKKVIKMLK